jgi:hypothetical protein
VTDDVFAPVGIAAIDVGAANTEAALTTIVSRPGDIDKVLAMDDI